MDGYRPRNIREALEIRANKSVIVLAGGTDFMLKYRKNADAVLYISHLKELKNIYKEKGYLVVGAATTLDELLKSNDIPSLLKNIISKMAAPAIKNIATIGGNICNASPAGDTLPFLYALDAKVVIGSLNGIREIEIENFIKGPGETDIKTNELLLQTKFPLDLIEKLHSNIFNVQTYRKVGTRRANALSKLSFLGIAEISKDLKDVRIAFGAVAPTVVRSRSIERKIVEGATIKDILEMYSDMITPIDDQRSTAFYRKTVSLRLLRYFLRQIRTSQ